ncbi:MAG TPA: hypothetical protein VGC82_15875 [Rhodopila sp.]
MSSEYNLCRTIEPDRPKEAFMGVRKLLLAALCASVALGTAGPAFADWDWHRHDRPDWHDRQEWRERQAWREREWREHEWRERREREFYRPPPVVAVPGYSVPPPVYYGNPGYYR